MAGNVVSNLKKYYGGQVPVPGQGDSDGKVKVLVEKTATIEIEGVQTDVELLYDADDLTTPVTPQQLGQWTDENYLIAFKTKDAEGTVRGFILYALETDSTSTDTLVNRAAFVNFKGDMTGDPGASAYEFTMVEDSSTLTRYLRDENGELIVKFNQATVEAGAQSGTLDNLIATDSEYMDFEIVHEGDNAYLNLNTAALANELENIHNDIDYILDALAELPSDEHGYFNSTLRTTPGDGTTTNIVIDDFRISQGRDVHGESIEFVPTHQEGGVDFGEVYLNPGTYIFTVHYTLQWVGNPRGTFLPLVTNVGDRPFDFSYEHEDVVRTTRIVTRTTRGKFSLGFPIDADTPPMGIWVKYLEIAQIASYNHPAVVHDTTLTGKGQLGDPLGVTPAAFGKIKDIPTSISQFRTGDVIPVDGPNGPAKMTAEKLLELTAENVPYKSCSTNACVGYFGTASGGSVCLTYSRSVGNASVDEKGIIIVQKVGNYHVSAFLTSNLPNSCPLQVLFDGTRAVIKDKSGTGFKYSIISKDSTFTESSELPAYWDSATSQEITPSKIGPSDGMPYKSCNANACVGSFGTASGGSVCLTYSRSVGNASVDEKGIIIVQKVGNYHVSAFLTSNLPNSCPLQVLFDGTRAVIKDKSGTGFKYSIISKDSTFTESSEFPSSWNNSTSQEIIPSKVGPVDSSLLSNSFLANQSQIRYLTAISRYHKAGGSLQDFCAMIVTDSHADWQSVDNARVCTDNFAPLQMLVHCGDATANTITRGTESITEWTAIVNAATKPVLFVMGNHEAGTYPNIKFVPTDENLYKIFIKPIVDKGFLVAGTYTQNKLYYYKDFTSAKTRVIVIDEYEAPEDVDTTYWEPITYNSSYSDVVDNTNYSAGDKVNVPGYVDYSFEAKSSFNSGSYYSGYQPKFKIDRGSRFISQTQAEWLISTLNSVPDGYSVMICVHQVFSNSISKVESKFTQADWESSPTLNSVMSTDLIALILKNFVAKTDQTISVSFTGQAAYVSGYSVDANFSTNTNELKNICLVGGHYHRDVVVKNSDDLVQVLAITSNTTYNGQYAGTDIGRLNTASGYCGVDSLTCIAIRDTGNTGLCKIGNNVTYYGTFRDIEIIKTL